MIFKTTPHTKSNIIHHNCSNLEEIRKRLDVYFVILGRVLNIFKRCQICHFPSFQKADLGPHEPNSKIGSLLSNEILSNQTVPIFILVFTKAFSRHRLKGRFIFEAKMSGWFLLRQPLKRILGLEAFWQKYRLTQAHSTGLTPTE